jgi:hypothetical protein
MLTQVKQKVIEHLWYNYVAKLPIVLRIQSALQKQYNETLRLDHFALIDLPGPYTGIRPLSELFSLLEFEIRGQDYLVEKQNEFVWLAQRAVETQNIKDALPQVVLADFRREALEPQLRKIIDKYAAHATPLDLKSLRYWKKQVLAHNKTASAELLNLILHYLSGRDWPLPTVSEFEIVKKSNELLAWVLVMGRQVNHFGWAIHLSENFANLQAFNQFISETLDIPLHKKGGSIKGNVKQGIEQSSTAAASKTISVADGTITVSEQFIEFVWRHSLLASTEVPHLWKDYFTGFIADNADRVVESLYLTP